MTDKEIYILLEEISGVKSFKNKQQKAEENFEKIEKEKVSIEGTLLEIEERIEQLSSEKNNYLEN